MNSHVPIPAARVVSLDMSEEAVERATRASTSHLSAIDRSRALPAHHPGAGIDRVSSAFPYPLISPGTLPPAEGRPPWQISIGGAQLNATFDMRYGGRIVRLVDRQNRGFDCDLSAVCDAGQTQGMTVRGGISWDVDVEGLPSAWSNNPVHGALHLPEILGGPRFRVWELERVSGRIVFVDFHFLPGTPAILVARGSSALFGTVAVGAGSVRYDRLRALPGRLSSAATALFGGNPAERVAPGNAVTSPMFVDPSGTGRSWCIVSMVPFESSWAEPLAAEAMRALDDEVAQEYGSRIVAGSHWATVESARIDARSRQVSAPIQSGSVQQAADSRRKSEQQWLHLLNDGGLGLTDRVRIDDVGHAAGGQWEAELRRSVRREALGDWRVHLRLGEIAMLRGDVPEARERWEWSHSLRPSPWADRNLALADLADNLIESASVRYLRAHRVYPLEPELGVEAVGCLLRAGRIDCCEIVLDRMAVHSQDASARYWLLRAEVAVEESAMEEAALHVGRAGKCVDGTVHAAWIDNLCEVWASRAGDRNGEGVFAPPTDRRARAPGRS